MRLLLLGVMVADMVSHLGARSDSMSRSTAQRASIAETCSCYGWKPGLTPVPVHE